MPFSRAGKAGGRAGGRSVGAGARVCGVKAGAPTLERASAGGRFIQYTTGARHACTYHLSVIGLEMISCPTRMGLPHTHAPPKRATRDSIEPSVGSALALCEPPPWTHSSSDGRFPITGGGLPDGVPFLSLVSDTVMGVVRPAGGKGGGGRRRVQKRMQIDTDGDRGSVRTRAEPVPAHRGSCVHGVAHVHRTFGVVPGVTRRVGEPNPLWWAFLRHLVFRVSPAAFQFL